MSEFRHSVKVPRLYKTASKILKSVREEGGSFQDLVFNQNKHSNIKGIHALVAEAIKFNNVLSRILNQTGILKFEKFDPWLAQILLTELIFGKKKLPGDSKPVLTILKYKDEILRELSVADIHNISSYSRRNHKASLKPRYVRVNTLKISLEDAINNFKDEGWTELQCPDSYDEYLQIIENRMFSKEYIFVKDYHINNLLVFPNGVVFYDHPAYLERYIILQDKASCLSTCCISLKPDSIILDMCAAPGMKTTLMAACINNEGKIYAVEQNVKRFNVMKELLHEFGVTCVESKQCDAGSVGPDFCKNVKYILVDPSCSGSGITSRVESITNQENNIDKLRLQRLSNLQGYLLRHALSNFPSAKYVIYSTCSLEEQENEMVVESVLGCGYFHGFSLINIKKKINGWKNFGSSKYECGEKCIYTRTESDFTNGGFLAVFKRNPKNDLSAFKIKQEKNREDNSSEKKKLKLSEQFFAYVNTLKITVEEAIQYFVDNGWNHLPSPVNYDIFLSGLQEDVNRVKEKFFEQDFHVKELLLFPMGIVDQLSEKFTYERKFILLDKVSCLAVHLLNPTPGTTVLDMSAGIEKMSLCIAARMNNEGIIYAYEPHYRSHKELTYELQVCGVSCVQTKFDSAVYSSSTDCPGVKLILVNPPCSGSGSDLCAAKKTQYSVQNKVISHSNSSDKELILRNYVVTQFSLLRHALTEFPEAVRVVYSTRSVHPEENEDIINALLVLAKFNGFSLINVANRIEGWKNECSVKYSFVSKCLVARDNTSITKGFFIAVFERNLNQQSKCNIDSSFTTVNANNNFTDNDYNYNCLKEKEASSEEQNSSLKLGDDLGNENSDTNNYSNYNVEEALCTESMSQKSKKKNKKVTKKDRNQIINNDEAFVLEKTKKSKKHNLSEESEKKLDTENSSGSKENYSHRDKKHASKMKRKMCDDSLDNSSKKSKKQKKDEVGESEKESVVNEEDNIGLEEEDNIGLEDTNDTECNSQLEMVKKRHKKKKKSYTNETEIPNNEIVKSDELHNDEVCSETRKKKKKKKDK